MPLNAKSTEDGNIQINNFIYELRVRKLGAYLKVFVNGVKKNNKGKWEITATLAPWTQTDEIPEEALKKIERELGNDEIILVGSKSTKKLVKIKKMNENLKNVIKKAITETINEQKNERYMFFSNLEQIKRQCEMLLKKDKGTIESILDDGHDWAQDHISEAKNNMDQVFDFLMNETNKKMVSESEKIKIGSKVKFKVKDVNDEPLYAGKTLTVVDKDGKRWKLKGNGFYTDATSKELEVIKEDNILDEGKKKAGTKLCSRGKSAAKSKFKVYPSAYANGYAVQVCKGKMPGTDGKKRCSPPYC